MKQIWNNNHHGAVWIDCQGKSPLVRWYSQPERTGQMTQLNYNLKISIKVPFAFKLAISCKSLSPGKGEFMGACLSLACARDRTGLSACIFICVASLRKKRIPLQSLAQKTKGPPDPRSCPSPVPEFIEGRLRKGPTPTTLPRCCPHSNRPA